MPLFYDQKCRRERNNSYKKFTLDLDKMTSGAAMAEKAYLSSQAKLIKIVNMTEEKKHAPGRIHTKEKIRENPKKALDNQQFSRYTGTVLHNGIERPKGNQDFCCFSKVCENRRISHRKPFSRWSAFAKFYNLWNRSGCILWSRSSPYKTVEPPE